jgi:hypothetical protein
MLMAISRVLGAPGLLVVALASCGGPPPDVGWPGTAALPAVAAGSHQPDEYTLSPQDLKLSCSKLTGRMQVRILQIRDYDQRKKPSATSRLAQQATSALYGSDRSVSDPEAEHRRDRAMLEVYNRQLAAKGCKSFDLEAELRPKPVRETPTPTQR